MLSITSRNEEPSLNALSPADTLARNIRGQVPLLRVLIADDHDLVRRGLKALIETQTGWTVCAEASNGNDAVKLAKTFRPDVAVLDVLMPELNGLEAARRIQKVSHETEILILSAYHSDQLVREVIESGIRGYILKSDADRDLLLAIETLARHKSFITPLAAQVADISGAETMSHDAALTSREREIAQLLAEGKSSKDVAVDLGLSVKTVETHRVNIMRKLKIHSLAGLVRYAIRNLIIEA